MVSIVIITKDTKDLLENLLASIEKDRTLQSLLDKTIIVDNASQDGTTEMVRDRFPSARYVRNEKNTGFAASANKGYALAEGKYILFLNSDTVMIEGQIVKMADFMDQNEDVAICGPQLVYADMGLQRSFADIPSLAGELLPFVRFRVRGSKFKGVKARGTDLGSLSSSPTPDPRPPTPVFRDVDSLIGAAILVRRETLARLDGFDEGFFFFLEETDLCVRARRSGKKVVFLPDVKIIHLQGKTVRKNWVLGRMEYNISLYRFIRKHHSRLYYRFFAGVRVTKAALFVVFLSLLFFLLAGAKIRTRYNYYLKLVAWHFRGCPADAGLRPV